MIYFSWINKEEPFDHKKHFAARNQALKIEVSQKEGSPAIAKITVPSLAKNVDKNYALIGYHDGEKSFCVFKGKKIASEKMDAHSICLSFEASHEKNYAQIEEIRNKYKKKPFYNEYIDANVLDAAPVVLWWDRITGDVTDSDYFNGPVIKIDTKYLEIYCEKKCPISQINIEIEAQWIQHLNGWINLKPWIEHKFPEKIVSSCTGKSLEKHWPRTGRDINSSGYKVAYSNIKEISPTGKEFPKYIAIKNKLAERKYYDIRLVVSWEFRQKRCEKIRGTLKSNACKGAEGESKDLKIRLKKIVQNDDLEFWRPFVSYTQGVKVRFGSGIYTSRQNHVSSVEFFSDNHLWKIEPVVCQSVRSSFFSTNAGRDAVNNVACIARNVLLKSARCFVTEVLCPMSFAGLSLNNTVVISSNGKKITGKIIEYELLSTYEKPCLKITVASSIGGSIKQPIFAKPESYIDSQYCTEYLQEKNAVHEIDAIGLKYDAFDLPHDNENDPLYSAYKFNPQDLIRNIFVANHPEQQIKKLHDSDREKSDISTKIKIDFLKIRPKGAIEKNATIKTMSVIETPNQITEEQNNE